MTTRSDTFNRADSSLTIQSPSDGGSNWVLGGGTSVWGVASNQAKFVSGGGTTLNTLYLEASSVSVAIETVFTTADGDSGVLARFVDDNNYHTIRYTVTGTVQAKANVAGVFTQWGLAVGTSFTSGSTAKVTVNASNNWDVLSDGVSQFTGTDTNHSSATKHGLWTNGGTTVRWDSITITDTGAASIFGSYYYRQVAGMGA